MALEYGTVTLSYDNVGTRPNYVYIYDYEVQVEQPRQMDTNDTRASRDHPDSLMGLLSHSSGRNWNGCGLVKRAKAPNRCNTRNATEAASQTPDNFK